jgi:uncharacterized protein YjbI with pentapeptide repeats
VAITKPFIMQIEENWSPMQLQSAYENGQRLFSNIDFTNDEKPHLFKCMNLNDAVFQGCMFHSSIFENCTLRRVRFVSSNLKCTAFILCDLSTSEWEDSSVCSIEFKGCQTSGLAAKALYVYGSRIDGAQEFVEGATSRVSYGSGESAA